MRYENSEKLNNRERKRKMNGIEEKTKVKTKEFPSWPKYNEKELDLLCDVLKIDEWCQCH